MHAWLCETLTGYQGLAWKEVPTPQPKAGEVRVTIHAASLNFPDVLIVQGKYQFKPPLPFVPGSEYAGKIDAVGEGVTHLKVGDVVAVFSGVGGFGTQACVEVDKVLALPSTFPLDEASAFLCTYGTGHHGLIDRAQLKAGETVLVLGAAGGVGTAAIQIAKAAGARVIAAASSDDKLALCREIGADATINYATADIRAELKALTGGRGPDVVYDPVGGDLAEPVFRSMAWRGRYLVVGFAQGSIPSLPLNLALLKGASIVGVFWGGFAKAEPQRSAQAMAELIDWYQKGKLKPVIDQRLPMASLPQAYERMASRQVKGKVVLVNEVA
ncbi:MAG: NADPH:quinone oxidoreductase [Rhizobacter sp.]|nr:NADPH:quinone oxidoreductase [Rhizobacter sp.]